MARRASALLPLACAALFARARGAAPGVLVFRNASENYHTFRLPALAALSGGALLACAEARARQGFVPPHGDTADCYGAGASAQDWRCTNKDVACKRSADGGRSWGAAAALALATDAEFFTNPQLLVADASAGVVFLEYMRCVSPTNGGSSFLNCTAVLRRSGDGGATWSAPADVPPAAQQSSGGFGGIVTAGGRLVFSPPSGKQTGALFSDDGGATWAWGAPLPRGGESQVAEAAPGGALLLTVRHANNSRVIYSSRDGGETWGPPAPQNVTDPNCQASLIAVHAPGAGARRLLFANPHTSGLLPSPYGRLNVTVQASDDGGATWAPILVVDPGPSAYTALAQLAPAGAGPASCAIMYEWSDDYPVDFFGISFLTFDCALPPLAS